jgi:uncharacterized protein YegL
MDPLLDCEPAAVTVTIGVSCPTELPLHVVFIVGRHLAMQDHLSDVKSSARTAVNAVEFRDDTLMGVISLSTQERVELPLTDRKSRVLSAISSIELDPINIFQNYYDWLGRAERMLVAARRDSPLPPVEAVVVYSTGCPTGFERYCGQLVGSANRLKGQGITVIGVCHPGARPFGFPMPPTHCRTLQQMSTNGYYRNLLQANQVANDLQELNQVGASLQLPKVELSEAVGPDFIYLRDTAAPEPRRQESPLSFEWADVAPGSLVTATYGITPTVAGTFPLRLVDSAVTLHDSLGLVSDPIPVPQRVVTVTKCLTATATPSPSPIPSPTPTLPPTTRPTVTSSPTPAPTATPTRTPEPGTVYLPVAVNRACRPEKVHADVVLAIDASGSMSAEADGISKIEAAKEAAGYFVDLLALGDDQAAVLSFNERPTLETQLTGDAEALRRAIEGITIAPGTRIDLALAVGLEELTSERARPENIPALILLTDGRPSEGTSASAEAAAADLKNRGIWLFVIGLGDDVDSDLLRRLATEPDMYYEAPTPGDLRSIYKAIAGTLPCPGGAPWEVQG